MNGPFKELGKPHDRCVTTRKAKFPTQDQAETWLREHRRTKGPNVPGMRAYRCLWCQCFHLTKGRKRGGKP